MSQHHTPVPTSYHLLFATTEPTKTSLRERVMLTDEIILDCVETPSEPALKSLLIQPIDGFIWDMSIQSPPVKDMLAIVRNLQPGIPFIALVEKPTLREINTMMHLGVDGIVEKTDTAHLIELVQREISSRRDARADHAQVPALNPPLYQQLSDILNSMQESIVAMSLDDRRIIFASASFESIFGYPIELFQHDKDFFKRVVHPEDLELATNAMNTCLSEGYAELDHRIVRPDGQVRWLHRRAWMTFDAQGKPIRVNDGARDITSQKLAEQALRESEERQRAILLGVPDLVFRLNANGVFIDYFAPTHEMLLFPPDQFLGKHFSDVLPSSISDTLAVILNQPYSDPIRFDYPLVFHNKTHYFEARVANVNQGEVVIIVRDVTEQKNAEKALRASEEKYRSLVESTDSVIAMYDVGGKTLYANQIAAGLLQHTTESILGKSMFELFPEEVAHYQLSHIREVIQSGVGQVNESLSFVAGEPRWYRTSIQPVRDDSGNIVAGLINATDITRVKASEESLRQSENYLRSLLNSETTFNIRVNTEGKITYCNQRYTAQFDWVAPSLIGMSPLDMILPEDHSIVYNAVGECYMHPEKPVQIEIRKQTEDGGYIWTLWEFSVVLDPNEKISQIHCVGFDITKQKRAEESLQESYQLLEQRVVERTEELQQVTNRLEAIFNNSGDAILLVDIKDGIKQANRTFREMLGIQPDDYLGQKLSAYFKCSKVGDIDSLAEQVTSNHQTQRVETCFHTPDGIVRNVEIGIAPVNNTEQAVSSLVCIVRDITERKQAEDALRESETRYRLLAENIKDVIIKIVPGGEITFVTPSCYHLSGHRPDELIGNNVRDFIYPEDADIGANAAMQGVQSKATFFVYQQRIPHKDGRIVWVEVTNTIVWNNDGTPKEFIGILHDITERKIAEDALRESEARYQSVLETQSELICRYLPDSTLTFVNEAYCKYFDKPANELIGRSFLELLPEAEREPVKQFYRELVQNRGTRVYEHMVTRPDGSIRWHNWTDTVIENKAGEVVAIQAVGIDITERKQAEAALQQALVQERELGDLKSRFVSMASHEFRNPLASILIATENLLLYRDRMDAQKIDERLDRIRQQVMHLKEIMDDVLQLARMQGGRLKYEPVYADMDSLCKLVVDEFEIQPEYMGRIDYSCTSSPLMTKFDEHLIRQVVNNLIHNALKYSTQDKRVYVKLYNDETVTVLKIRDEGIGIPGEDLKRLFEPFHRAENVGDIEGTGLGLSIAKQAVEMHGGTIEVESEMGYGTTFTVQLPRLQPVVVED